MSVIDYLLIAAAIPAIGAFVCRLTTLDMKKHSPLVIAMHIGMAIAVAQALWDAVSPHEDVSAGDVAAVLAAISWLAISFKTWKNGVPAHFTKPEALQEARLHDVSGGRKD